ncbi:unnamed protein product [marine sediment metagenome]|uniref:ABC transmembrane type-1 domain-containing protein n=1 Tax=marine sediment metagenome TaxID=412755 RepID=X1K960_9ZZZZ
MKLTSRQREAVAGYLFLMPWIIGFIWFNIGPIIVSFFLSLCKYDLINFEFIGLSNYKKFITDELFWQSLKVTSIYTFFVVFLNTVGGLLVAMLLNQKIKGLGIFRTIFYLPTVVSGIAVALWYPPNRVGKYLTGFF